MNKYYINVFDNDYRTLSYTEVKEFETLQEAEEYCEDESWTGETYMVDEVHYPEREAEDG